jgi:hypothetical protein
MMLLGLGLAQPALAEVVEIAASAEARVVRLVDGSPVDTVETQELFPETQTELPLQVLADLLDLEDGGAAVAAQFADPLTAVVSNPEEFALTIALGSDGPDAFTGTAVLTEQRTVVFSEAEVLAAAGEEVELVGIFFLDAALAILDTAALRDLTGAEITLSVVVEQQFAAAADNGSGGESGSDPESDSGSDAESDSGSFSPPAQAVDTSQTLLDLTLTVVGGPDGTLITSVEGSDELGLFEADLAELLEDFSTARVAATDTAIQFPYTAVVGEEFDFVVTVSAEAKSLPDGNLVALLVGAPFDSFFDVATVVVTDEAAAATLEEIETNTPFGDDPEAALGLLSCPLVGLLPLAFSAAACFAPRRRQSV